MLHGAGTFTYIICLKNHPNIGKYPIPVFLVIPTIMTEMMSLITVIKCIRVVTASVNMMVLILSNIDISSAMITIFFDFS